MRIMRSTSIHGSFTWHDSQISCEKKGDGGPSIFTPMASSQPFKRETKVQLNSALRLAIFGGNASMCIYASMHRWTSKLRTFKICPRSVLICSNRLCHVLPKLWIGLIWDDPVQRCRRIRIWIYLVHSWSNSMHDESNSKKYKNSKTSKFETRVSTKKAHNPLPTNIRSWKVYFF